MRHPLLLLCLATSACFDTCIIEPPENDAIHDVGSFTVVSGDSGSIAIDRGSSHLLYITGVDQRRGVATYDMEFGMFDIVDDAEPSWTHASSSVRTAGPSWKMRSDDGDLAQVDVTAASANHLVLDIAGTDPSRNRTRITFQCDDNTHFAGLGAQTHDVDHMGQKVPLFVSEQGVGKTDTDELPSLWQLVGRRHSTHIPMPIVITNQGSAWVVETHAYAEFDLCSSGNTGSIEVWESALRLHVFAAGSPLAVLSDVTAWTGRPRLPAPWLFAPWNDAIFGTESVRTFASFLRDNAIPSSAIWSEDWKGGTFDGMAYRLDEDWRLDEGLYPNFRALTSELRAKGIAMQLYFNTFVYKEADIWQEAVDGNHLISDVNGEPWVTTGAKFTDTAFADLTSESTRNWVKGFLADMIELGALGWMADFAEWAPIQGARVASGEDPAIAHNRYPLLWQQVNNAALDESGKRDEMIVYYRSGHLGSQPLAQVVWAGDQRTSFQPDDGLPTVIPIGLGLAATGFPFFAHDIGGYQSATNPPSTKELFFRWTTLGALTPVMRTHHGTNPTQNWRLDKDAETLAHYRRWANFHVQLYPYWRRLALDAVNEGSPLWIPLGLMFPSEDAAWPIKDQFHLGHALLVAPVVTEGATSRPVYIPTGRYAPLDGGDAVMGPTTITVDAPLDEIPIFIRAGGIVPMTAQPAQTLFANVDGVPGLESTEGDRIVHVGLGAAGSFVEESGATYSLTGTGTSKNGLTLDEDGFVVVTGNQTVQGEGFSFTLTAHPAGRTTRIMFR